MKYIFFCDFDGTVTKEDVIDRILEEFADPMWKDIERVLGEWRNWLPGLPRHADQAHPGHRT